MTYKCNICGQTFKSPNGPNTSRHLKSKRHITALEKNTSITLKKKEKKIIKENIKETKESTKRDYFGVHQKEQENKEIQIGIGNLRLNDINSILHNQDYILTEILLFQAINYLKNPTYQNILGYIGSFGIKSEQIIKVLVKKLKDGDVKYKNLEDETLKIIYRNLFKSLKFEYPLTIKVIEAFNYFPEFKFENPLEIIDFFKNLEKKYSGIAILSSSKIGAPEDLITFKRIFPNSIQFKLSKRWAL